MLFAQQPITFPGLGIEINPSSVAFTLFGKDIYWYGLIIACAMLLAYFVMTREAPRFGFTEDDILNMLIAAVPIGIIGARFYYCLFQWDSYKNNPISVLYVWEGGLAIYGAIIFGLLGLVIYCKVSKKPLSVCFDLTAFGVLIGQILGRWGNFFNREAYGYETDLPWRMGVGNTNELGEQIYQHPTFLYESLWNLIGLILMHFISKKRKYDGEVFTFYAFWYGLGRAWIEGLRTDSLYLFDTGLRVSQLIAILCVWVAGFLLVRNCFFTSHDPADLYVNRVRAAGKAAEAASDGEPEETAASGECSEENAETAEAAAEAEAEEQPEASAESSAEPAAADSEEDPETESRKNEE